MGGSLGSGPTSAARVVRKLVPKWAPRARIWTKMSATGAGFCEEADVEGSEPGLSVDSLPVELTPEHIVPNTSCCSPR